MEPTGYEYEDEQREEMWCDARREAWEAANGQDDRPAIAEIDAEDIPF